MKHPTSSFNHAGVLGHPGNDKRQGALPCRSHQLQGFCANLRLFRSPQAYRSKGRGRFWLGPVSHFLQERHEEAPGVREEWNATHTSGSVQALATKTRLAKPFKAFRRRGAALQLQIL